MASPFELEFGDSPFDGHPRNFADAKAIICAHSKKAGVAWIAAAGKSLLKAKGKLSSICEAEAVVFTYVMQRRSASHMRCRD